MNRFAALYQEIDATTSTNDKVAAMARYFERVEPADGAWAVFLLTGEKIKRLVPSGVLKEWGIARAEIEPWLFAESYGIVGDLAETLTLLVGDPASGSASPALSLADWIESRILPLRGTEPDEMRLALDAFADELGRDALFCTLKLLTGGLRVGVSKTLVTRALAEAFGIDRDVIARRLMGSWKPSPEAFTALGLESTSDEEAAKPYPFFLASPIIEPTDETPMETIEKTLGDPSDWRAEWKWDGIRAQAIKRRGEYAIWSRGDENLTERFPELIASLARLPQDAVLDGELLAWRDGAPLPFAVLQRRIGRLNPSEKIMAEAPCAFLVYDLLELDGEDLRQHELRDRLGLLRTLVGDDAGRIVLSESIDESSWAAYEARRGEARGRGVEGLMLKRLASPYRVGRVRGDWWKWKIDPLTVDAVLTYAQPGHGKRANLFTDYTFGAWDPDSGGELVTFTKAYSGLTNEEIGELDMWIRKNTVERFGPVRRVKAEHVFEIAFEGIQRSPRHKAGIALRFPRIARWRRDKPTGEADTLASIRALIGARDV